MGAHPRSRGENNGDVLCPRRERGSSPLTRGKLFGGLVRGGLHGLIPAHAGKTNTGHTWSGAPWAHPRSRGENSPPGGATVSSEGSSPLTRGKRDTRLKSRTGYRLIPAHAGKTTGRSGEAASNAAHPRSRGENCRCSLFSPSLRGSSPLTRGKRAVQDGHALGGGSSPLTRGKHHAASPLTEVEGLIPAHAGKTRPRGRSGLQRRAHPRSRGENTPPLTPPVNRLGSSPLTRGKRVLLALHSLLDGLIPAHAGKTRTGWGPGRAGRAHPRSRGENQPVPERCNACKGSSPLTRGKRSHHGPRRLDRRLIPAHAGKT